MSQVSIAPLDDKNAFLKRWSALFERAGNRSVFLSPAWMTAWLADTPTDVRLYKVESDGENAALMGVFGLRGRNPAIVGASTARLHEVGNEARDAIYIEHNDFLVADDNSGALHRAAVEATLQHFDCVDCIVFRNVSPTLAKTVRDTAAARGRNVRTLREQPLYIVDLANVRAAGGDYVATLSSSRRAKIRRAMRLYEERGPLSCNIASNPAGQRDAWETLVRLHQASWEARGKAGVFANPQFSAFHERLKAAAPDAFQLVEMRAGEETIGVLYKLVMDKRVYGYQAGFLYENDNRLTPGFVCHALAAQHYADEGYDAYDFLAGDDDYKRRLGVQLTTLSSLVVDNPTWRNRLRKLVKRP